MTQEDKQLLLKDLCARLPYGVECEIRQREGLSPVLHDKLTCGRIKGMQDYDWCVKPYLRPMSSMTEEEKDEFQNLCNEMLFGCIFTSDRFDWLNAHHFDYRNLIHKGLALEAHEGMYD